MEHNFWHSCWETKNIGFHQKTGNSLLPKVFPKMKCEEEDNIFLPLCGKTKDIHWFLSKGLKVTGCELSRIAIDELFEELNVEPKIRQHSNFIEYSSHNLCIYVGDIFGLTADMISPVNGIYDRAALIALPRNMRAEYAKHIKKLSGNCRQIIITLDYKTEKEVGPPFAVSESEIERLYAGQYQISQILRSNDEYKIRGEISAFETVYLLEPAM